MPTANKRQHSPMSPLELVNLMTKVNTLPEEQLFLLPPDFVTFHLPNEPTNIVHMFSMQARCPYKLEDLAVAENIQIWQKNTVKK